MNTLFNNRFLPRMKFYSTCVIHFTIVLLYPRRKYDFALRKLRTSFSYFFDNEKSTIQAVYIIRLHSHPVHFRALEKRTLQIHEYSPPRNSVANWILVGLNTSRLSSVG